MYHEGENNEQASKNHVIGSFNTHLASRTPRMPITGETILGGPLRMGPAGQGANQAVAVAGQGAEVTLVIELGKDLFGDLAIARAEAKDISEAVSFADAAAVLNVTRVRTTPALPLPTRSG